jgi:hypothetical protein
MRVIAGPLPASLTKRFSKVGRAAGVIALIRDACREDLNKLDDEDEKQELAHRSEAAANATSGQDRKQCAPPATVAAITNASWACRA